MKERAAEAEDTLAPLDVVTPLAGIGRDRLVVIVLDLLGRILREHDATHQESHHGRRSHGTGRKKGYHLLSVLKKHLSRVAKNSLRR